MKLASRKILAAGVVDVTCSIASVAAQDFCDPGNYYYCSRCDCDIDWLGELTIACGSSNKTPQDCCDAHHRIANCWYQKCLRCPPDHSTFPPDDFNCIKSNGWGKKEFEKCACEGLYFEGCNNDYLCKSRERWAKRINFANCGYWDTECQCPHGVDFVEHYRPEVERCKNEKLNAHFQDMVQSTEKAECTNPCSDDPSFHYQGCDNEYLCSCFNEKRASDLEYPFPDVACECPDGIALVNCLKPEVEACDNSALNMLFQDMLESVERAECHRFTSDDCHRFTDASTTPALTHNYIEPSIPVSTPEDTELSTPATSNTDDTSPNHDEDGVDPPCMDMIQFSGGTCDFDDYWEICKCRNSFLSTPWVLRVLQCQMASRFLECMIPHMPPCGNDEIYQSMAKSVQDDECLLQMPTPCMDEPSLQYDGCDNKYLCECFNKWNTQVQSCKDMDIECLCLAAGGLNECYAPEVLACTSSMEDELAMVFWRMNAEVRRSKCDRFMKLPDYFTPEPTYPPYPDIIEPAEQEHIGDTYMNSISANSSVTKSSVSINGMVTLTCVIVLATTSAKFSDAFAIKNPKSKRI